jgi:hypothetical protein
MKTKLTLICLALLVLVTESCKEDDFDPQNPDVGQFVGLIKSGQYFEKVGYELPSFSMQDIDALVTYLHDTTEINEYPTNPISSKLTLPKILNECLMWTIDGIRLETKYPSLEPSLKTPFEEGFIRLTKRQILEISEKYINWHKAYKANPSETLRKQDLLEDTVYRWD